MRSFFLCLSLAAACPAFGQATNIVIEPTILHLGKKEIKAFPEDRRKPVATRLDRAFQAESNASEWTLRLNQRNVTDRWNIELNGNRLGHLNIQGSDRVSHFGIPPGGLVDGTNSLTIIPTNPADDILVGDIEAIPQRMKDLLKLGHVALEVTDPSGTMPTPVRVTVANAAGKLADLYNVQPNTAAWRKGIIYSGGSPMDFDLPEGDWIISATRGTEWTRPRFNMRMFVGQSVRVSLPITRDVDTTGFIAADTHLHTYTFSGHGDASLDERINTLAGEGIELAIATDHNHFTDYKPRQDALGASQYFTSVIGNEVTTVNGHFNAFPFTLDSEKPDHKQTNWVKLVADIRAKGGQFVILNHPRWPAITNSPLSIWGLNRADGTRTNEVKFTMDAVELSNSSVPVKDSEFLLRDWFALLNRGERLWAVGASDTHTIADPPGQGRTYVASGSEEAATIDVDAAIKAMQAGNMSVSYGIFGRVTVNGATMGQTTKPKDDLLKITFHVACPDWIKAQKAVVFLNGIKVAQQDLTMVARTSLSTNVIFEIAAPAHDAHLVCAAFGEGVKDASWKTLSDYTLAATNPIFVDADQDGKYSSPRESALALLKKTKLTAEGIRAALVKLDPAIAVQILSEAKLLLPASELAGWNRLLEDLSAQHDLYLAYRTAAQGR